MDFVTSKYKILLQQLVTNDFKCTSFADYLQNSHNSQIFILRHDVDLLPQNALAMAQLEHDLGIRGTYYFRIVPASFNPQIIEQIAKFGHEVGYHYEDVSLVAKAVGSGGEKRGNGETEYRSDENQQKNLITDTPIHRYSGSLKNISPDLIDRAMESFLTNLEKMRKIVDVKTICMHGSPISKYDNRLLWTKYNYRDYGIVGEPYFDVDFSEVAYYTDTGRRWDGDAVSVRDKVVVGERCEVIGDRTQVSGDRLKVSSNVSALNTYNLTPLNSNVSTPNTSHLSPHTYFPKFRSTKAMVKAIEEGRFPNTAMLTIHPHRWHDRTYPWLRELFWQNVKNVGKYMLVKIRR